MVFFKTLHLQKTGEMLEQLKDAYHYLFEDELLTEIHQVGLHRKFLQDDILIEIGEQMKFMPLLLNGAIKILREDENGDELLLYFLERGDTCAMTLTCCLGNNRSKIQAVSETSGELILIPIEKMEDWIVKYKSWRAFVLESYNNRLMEMLEAIDTLAFMNMDERLYKYLTDKAKVLDSEEISTTHQEIATEMHTSRVVISRLLKNLEIEGKVKMNRNKIKILQF